MGWQLPGVIGVNLHSEAELPGVYMGSGNSRKAPALEEWSACACELPRSPLLLPSGLPAWWVAPPTVRGDVLLSLLTCMMHHL